MSNRSRSEQIYQKLCEVIPGGVNSPVRSCSSMGQLPMVIDHAYQDTLVDVDGKKYIDFCGSWGALIHGHAHPVILKAVQERMQKGTSFGITTSIEGELAQEVVKLIDSIEKVRFVSSGTEATMSVARLARGYTGKELLVKFIGNYHGHADFFLVQAGSGVLEVSPTASSAGIPSEIVKHTLCLPYNDIEACRKVFQHPNYRKRIAAVILEPIAGNMGVVPATKEFMQFLRQETQEMGALLILDEVITGFRVSQKGAQHLYSVKPDLTCLGKIVGGGFPAAAFGGRKDIMNHLAPLGPVYQAGTLSGNPLAMEAGLQSLKLLQQPQFYENLQHKTDFFIKPIEEQILQKKWPACIQQVGSMFTLFFGKKEVTNLKEALEADSALFARFFRDMFEQGIYVPPSQHEAWFISQAHEEKNLEKARNAVLKFMEEAYS
ncbi:glutamate-1-semialdehyde 2,1-aminomutase [Candidatus Protochlamydia phocaeensis]|uniref:glutamate-1-semialdehyde 2,1-aminomutase n=1 Tax=Candidatus Protochlamydia phocaeensis TaxID=1414722 RepID=UPI000839853C|nr:glutamate-1-semialdehyde 2,1-aminomutase [Candidatus Protochlamydia phocaeensis]